MPKLLVLAFFFNFTCKNARIISSSVFHFNFTCKNTGTISFSVFNLFDPNIYWINRSGQVAELYKPEPFRALPTLTGFIFLSHLQASRVKQNKHFLQV
ncbi:hypothetical protein RhiirA5_430685 [Rhizophagus irregularis]|uniref:Uncharacterized protein n=1 Tax=Rhizophagus irregularis TaxID=588596 RepID=A0A2N0NWC6_9GLOM|nr:hypothetical protein RhiirA5_430685 [Rhizophagus irregularis]